MKRGQPFSSVHPVMIGGKEEVMEGGFLLGLLIGFVVGGGGIWYFKVLSLQKSVLTMTGEYQRAERGRRDLEAKSRA